MCCQLLVAGRSEYSSRRRHVSLLHCLLDHPKLAAGAAAQMKDRHCSLLDFPTRRPPPASICPLKYKVSSEDRYQAKADRIRLDARKEPSPKST